MIAPPNAKKGSQNAIGISSGISGSITFHLVGEPTQLCRFDPGQRTPSVVEVAA